MQFRELLKECLTESKAGRCQSRKDRERGSVPSLEARPSGLYWSAFQRSNVWLSHRNYFSRTNLFIAVRVLIALLHPKQARSLGRSFCLLQRDKNTSCFHNSNEQKVTYFKKYVWKTGKDIIKAKKKSMYECVFCVKQSWMLYNRWKLNLLNVSVQYVLYVVSQLYKYTCLHSVCQVDTPEVSARAFKPEP